MRRSIAFSRPPITSLMTRPTAPHITSISLGVTTGGSLSALRLVLLLQCAKPRLDRVHAALDIGLSRIDARAGIGECVFHVTLDGRDVHAKLSAAIHNAESDAKLFDDSCAELIEHFDARALFKLPNQPKKQ